MFSNMKPAERKLLEACQKGKMLNPGEERPSQKMADNEIRGSFLRALILSNNQEIEVDKKKVTLKIDPKGVMFSGIYISGTFDFSFCSTNLQFSFKNSRFENRLNLSDSKIRFLSLKGSIVPSLDAFRLVCESNIFIGDGFESNGEINFNSAQIEGSLNCINGKFINKNGDALNCDKVKIIGSIFLRDGFEAQGKVNFNSAQINGSLSCINGKFNNENGVALNCDRAKISGSVFLGDGFEANGKVNFISAQIGSNLECVNGKFLNKNKDALNCDRTKIGGSVLLRDGFEAKGKVNFNSAQIGIDLFCDNGKFNNKNGNALNCDRTKIGGSVFLRGSFQANGKVNFNSAQINGSLSCIRGKFNNENGDALNCDRAKIGGSVFLRDGFEGNGKINFNSAQIGSNLECNNGKFNNERGDALNCDRTKVEGSVFLQNGFEANGKVIFHSCFVGKSLIFSNVKETSFLTLNFAQISRLKLNIVTVKKIDLDGCVYEHLDSLILLKWLEKMPKNETFKPQPYKQLAKVLRNMGHNKEADNVMIEYNEQLRKIDLITCDRLFVAILKWIYGFTAGYGYKPMRVIFTMFVIWLSCGWLYQETADIGVFAPSNPLIFQNTKYDSNVNKCGIPKSSWEGSYIAYKDDKDIFYCEYKKIEKDEKQLSIKNDNWTTNQNLHGEYSTFSPYWYSLDILLPIVDLQMDEDWGVFISSINSDITLNHVTRWIVWIEILLGWIYSLILVAILSGLAKNEKD